MQLMTPHIRIRDHLIVAVALIALIGASGCTTTPTDRIEASPDVYAGLPADIQERVKRGEIDIGFPRDAVRLALGDPQRIITREEAAGVTGEAWVYQGYETHQTHFGGYYSAYTHPHGWIEGSRSAYYGHPDHYIRTSYPRIRVEFENGRVVAIERDDR